MLTEKEFLKSFPISYKMQSNSLRRVGTISIISDRIINRNSKKAILCVKDTYQRIENYMLPKLFWKFTTRSFSGTGLRLYIFESIIDAHDCTICAENNIAGKGASFHLLFLSHTNVMRNSSFLLEVWMQPEKSFF